MSGVWTDFKVTSPEDQQKFLVSMNELSEKIFYNQRFIIDNKVDVLNGAEPRAWVVTKVNRVSANGVALITLAQDYYNQHTDYVEYEDPTDPSTIIGMWADYYTGGIHPQEPEEQEDTAHIEMTYSGSKQEMRIGGSYKKFTVKFYGPAGEDKPYQTGNWTFTVNGEDVSQLVTTLTSQDSDDVAVNEIKAKFGNDDTYIGEVLKITFTSASGLSASVEMSLTI